MEFIQRNGLHTPHAVDTFDRRAFATIVSPVWSSARGSIAGTTYLTTPSGQIIARQRTRPVISTSPGSTAAKDALIQSVAGWDALSAQQKSAWNQWASANGNKTGRQEYLAGHCLMNYGILTVPPIWAAPNVTEHSPDFNGHPGCTLVSAPFLTAGKVGVAFQLQNVNAYGCVGFIELSPMLSNGRNYWKGPWDTALNQSDALIPAEKHTFTFEDLIEGARYYARARVVSNGALLPQRGTVVSPALITFSTAVSNVV